MSSFTMQTINAIKGVVANRKDHCIEIQLRERANVAMCMLMTLELQTTGGDIFFKEPIVSYFVGDTHESSGVFCQDTQNSQGSRKIVLKLPDPIPICKAALFVVEDGPMGKMRRQREFSLP